MRNAQLISCTILYKFKETGLLYDKLRVRAQNLSQEARFLGLVHSGEVSPYLFTNCIFDRVLESGKEIKTLFEHSEPILNVAITPDGLWAISRSLNELIVWDLNSGSSSITLPFSTRRIKSIAITSDGIIASDFLEQNLVIWNLQTGNQLKTLLGHTSFVNNFAITPDGNIAVWTSNDGIEVWDVKSGKVLNSLLQPSSAKKAIAITDDARIAVSSLNANLYVWNLQTGEKLKILEGHTGCVNSVVITPNKKYIVSTSIDKTLKVWDLETAKVIASFTGDDDLRTCAIARDGVTIVAGEDSGRLLFLRLEGI